MAIFLSTVIVGFIALEVYFYLMAKSNRALAKKYGRYREAFDEFDINIFVKQLYLLKNRITAEPYLIYKLLETKETYDPKKVLTVNSYGFRAPEPFKKEKGRTRICVLGSSVAFGAFALRNETALPALIEKRLNELSETNTGFEVINCAVGGYVSAQQLIELELTVLDIYRPDAVIFLDGFNDFSSILHHERVGLPLVWKEYGKMMNSFINNRFFFIAGKMFYGGVIKKSNVFNYLAHGIKRIIFAEKGKKNIRAENYTALFRQGASYYYNVHRLANSLLKDMGVRFISILQPAAGYGAKALTPFEKMAVSRYNLSVYGEHYNDFLKIFYDSSRALLSGSGMNWIDLTPVFDDIKESIFVDAVHTGDRGARIMADKIAKEALGALRGR